MDNQKPEKGLSNNIVSSQKSFMKIEIDKIQKFGNILVDVFHYLALFMIGATIVWTATYEYLQMAKNGYATLKDILLLFISLELGAMVGVYFKTKKLPVQFLVFVAITGLSRHLVIDVQHVTEKFQLFLLLSISFSILLLSVAIFVLAYTVNKFGCPDDVIQKTIDTKETNVQKENSSCLVEQDK